MTLNDILPHVNAKKIAGGWHGYCPSHDDQRRSLSLGEREGKLLLHCHAGCTFKEIMMALPQVEKPTVKVPAEPEKVVDTYEYQNEDGSVAYTVSRTNHKNFYQHKPDGTRLGDAKRLLYRLPRVIKASTVFFVEGEKDVHSLEKLGFAATTVSGGANESGWKPYFSGWFKGKKVVLLPDNDEPGEKFMTAIANHLLPVASKVKIVNLPNLGYKGDVSDWLMVGHTKEELVKIVQEAEDYIPDGSDEPIPLSTLAKRKPKQQKWVVDQLVPCTNTTVIAARPGQYKTYLAFEMMFARQDGHFIDQFKTRKGRSLFIDGENGMDTLARRVHELRDKPIDYGNSMFFWYLEGRALNKELAVEIVNRAKKLKCDTVFFDPYRQFMGGDEDNSGDAAKFTRLLTIFHKEGIAVVLIHHLRKAIQDQFNANQEPTMDEIRGSSALNGHARSIIVLRKNEEGVGFYQVKSNLGTVVDPFIVGVEDGPRFSYKGQGARVFTKHEEIGQAVLSLLEGTTGAGRQDVLGALTASGYNETTVDLAIKGLIAEGKLYKRKEGRSYWYYLPKDKKVSLPYKDE